MAVKLHYASAPSEENAQVVLFGANTVGASHAPSHQTTSNVTRDLFSADVARAAENESPSLSEKMIVGDNLYDSGNLDLPTEPAAQVDSVLTRFQQLFEKNKIPLCLGGDHLIKYAGIAALHTVHPDAYVIYLDAHPDCHMTDRLYYGSILHKAFSEHKTLEPQQVILLGLRQANAIEKQGYDHYKMPTIWGMDFSLFTLQDIYQKLSTFIPSGSKLYFSIDLDGLNPSDTPGIEQPCPGGPTVNQLIALFHLLSEEYQFTGLDITEFLPAIDDQKLTALAMARIAKEFSATCRPQITS